MTMTWYTFKTRQGETMQVAFHGKHRYMISRGGWLVIAIKRADTSIYEGMFRSPANARCFAGELAEFGGPAR